MPVSKNVAYMSEFDLVQLRARGLTGKNRQEIAEDWGLSGPNVEQAVEMPSEFGRPSIVRRKTAAPHI